MSFPTADPRSFLFVTLDSCRYDTFRAARAPHLKALGTLHRAMAPAHFTFASHQAMFVGFTPGDAKSRQPFVNPKWAKIFQLESASRVSGNAPFVHLEGRNIKDGFKRLGYSTLGSGAAEWFNTQTPGGQLLTSDFDQFFFAGDLHSLQKQLDFLAAQIAATPAPHFVFLNVGETHIPYYHEGAPWPPNENFCKPFGTANDRRKCQTRQRACVEWIDGKLAPLLDAFAGASTLVCGDHGDAWGEDGLWAHGFFHQKVLEVPLVFRLQTA